MNKLHRNEMIILHGPEHWQVIQQQNGSADLWLDGSYCAEDITKGFELMARIVDESNQCQVVYWTKCEKNSFTQQTIPADDRHGSWSIRFYGVKAGGPYRIETGIVLETNNWSTEFMLRGDMIHHIGIGNLIAAAGQSNSVGFGRETVFDPPEYGISVLSLSGHWNLAAHPLYDATGATDSENCDALNTGHSPWLALAKEIKRYTNMPVGIIPLGQNGASIDAWDSKSGGLYRNMKNVMAKAGNQLSMLLWYQGCTDANSGDYKDYYEKLSGFIKAIQCEDNYTGYPIVIIQLNRSTTRGSRYAEGWRRVRDAQRLAAEQFPDVCCIPTYDIGLISDDIHNNSYGNLTIASRIFECTKHIFMNGIKLMPPTISRAQVSETNPKCARLFIKNVIGVLEIRKYKEEYYPFLIEGATGDKIRIMLVTAEDKEKIVIEAEEELQQCFVSYVPQVILEGNHVYDSANRLPLVAFDRIPIE